MRSSHLLSSFVSLHAKQYHRRWGTKIGLLCYKLLGMQLSTQVWL